jgi:hypothetical protein
MPDTTPRHPFTDEELKRATAHHEAGHAVLALVSRFYQLTDPAMVLAATVDATAQSGARPRQKGLPSEVDMALEQVEIALAGLAAEMLFEEITELEGRRIVMHAESCDGDLQFARGALAYWKSSNKLDALTQSAYRTLKTHRADWEEIAEFARMRIGVTDKIAKAELEALPAAQRLMAAKRPL